MTGLPRVTILLASHNRLPMLQQAIASALGQRYEALEVLVVDDGSDAPTRQWLLEQSREEPRLRVHCQQNQGVAAARQAGLLRCRGELVCILDSDDRLVPEAVSRMVRVFEQQPDTALVYCNYHRIRSERDVELIRLPRFTDNAAMIRATLIRPRVPFKHSGTMFRRELAIELGGYDPALPMKIDIDLFLRFLAAGHRLELIEEPMVEFIVHGGSISLRRLEGMRVWCRMIDMYGPRRRWSRAVYKSLRCGAELLKQGYETLNVRKRQA